MFHVKYQGAALTADNFGGKLFENLRFYRKKIYFDAGKYLYSPPVPERTGGDCCFDFAVNFRLSVRSGASICIGRLQRRHLKK